MNDDQAGTFMTAIVDRTIVNVTQVDGFGESPTTTLIFDDGTELAFDTDSIAQVGSAPAQVGQLAKVIWDASSDDEGTISAAGAEVVARAVLAAGYSL